MSWINLITPPFIKERWGGISGRQFPPHPPFIKGGKAIKTIAIIAVCGLLLETAPAVTGHHTLPRPAQISLYKQQVLASRAAGMIRPMLKGSRNFASLLRWLIWGGIGLAALLPSLAGKDSDKALEALRKEAEHYHYLTTIRSNPGPHGLRPPTSPAWTYESQGNRLQRDLEGTRGRIQDLIDFLRLEGMSIKEIRSLIKFPLPPGLKARPKNPKPPPSRSSNDPASHPFGPWTWGFHIQTAAIVLKGFRPESRTYREREREFESLWSGLHRQLTPIAYKGIRDSELAKEILNTAGLQLWKFHFIKGKKIDDLLGWMSTTTRNVKVDLIRRRHSVTNGDAFTDQLEIVVNPTHHKDSSPALETSTTQKLMATDFLDWLKANHPLDALLLWQHYVEGFQYYELADLHKMDGNTVRSRIYRAIKKIRKEWAMRSSPTRMYRKQHAAA